MAEQVETPVRRGLAEKRASITKGGLAVFARDGYTRASIDAIATEAGVSTRTIYNHFKDKEQLFHTVIQESATKVADAQIALLDRYLGKITNLEEDLTTFGRVWATPMPAFADHFAMVRQIRAEVGHIPQATLEAWLEAGPKRVQRELTQHMQRLADKGLLSIDNADRAAMHLVLLTATEVANRSYNGVISLKDTEIADIAATGVQTFLYGYLPRRTGRK
jgi:AcrR family transcriptional regulator